MHGHQRVWATDLRKQRQDLFDFAVRSRLPIGFRWQDDRGGIDNTAASELWITCRMTHAGPVTS
jgi:hypothetical protein